jgi:DNA replication and repair protein RecF
LFIQNIFLEGFRNFTNFSTEFHPQTNLIYGCNGVGKTSILEAIFFLSFRKSFLNVKKTDLINYNQQKLIIRASIESNTVFHTIKVILDTNFSILMDEKKQSIIDINRYFNPVYFSSANYSMYVENKPYLRRLFNRFIFSVYPLYMHYVFRYNHAIKQKNYLLKSNVHISTLSSWNRELSRESVNIMKLRKMFINDLNTEILNKFNIPLEIYYQPSHQNSDEINEESIFIELEKVLKNEIKLGRLIKGVHLDSYKIKRNMKDLMFFSSGEKKINLLIIYLAFLQLFKKVRNDYPVFLIDDYDTAMDTQNIEFLISHYPHMQIIATSVRENSKFNRVINLQ